MKPALGPFVGAIKELRKTLNETQEGMARRLGVSLSGYRYWESGQRTPSAGWLVRLHDLALEVGAERVQTALMFRDYGQSLRLQENARMGASSRDAAARRKLAGENLPEPETPDQDEILHLFSDAAQGLNLVWEAAMAGHAGAREVLADLADKLATRGGNWQQMKYLKKKK